LSIGPANTGVQAEMAVKTRANNTKSDFLAIDSTLLYKAL